MTGSNKFFTFLSGARQLVTAIATSAGVADANKIVSTNSTGRLDTTLMPPGLGLDTSSVIASETLAAGDFVNIYNNSGTRNMRKADASNGRPAHGFVLASVTSGSTGTVYHSGENTAVSSLTPGAELYLSATTPGGFTATAPTASGQIIQTLGYASSATSLNYEFDSPVLIA